MRALMCSVALAVSAPLFGQTRPSDNRLQTMEATVQTAEASLRTQRDVIQPAVIEALAEWAASRDCQASPGVASGVATKFNSNTSVILHRATMYDQTLEFQKNSVKGLTYAYMDAVASDARDTGFCVITTADVQRTSFPTLAGRIDSGTLEVDGTTRGAHIKIDGQRKGVIKQAFVVSVGEHVWETMKCKNTVTIKPGDYVVKYCDKP